MTIFIKELYSFWKIVKRVTSIFYKENSLKNIEDITPVRTVNGNVNNKIMCTEEMSFFYVPCPFRSSWHTFLYFVTLITFLIITPKQEMEGTNILIIDIYWSVLILTYYQQEIKMV